MKNLFVATVVLLSSFLSLQAEARDDLVTLELKPVMESNKAKEALLDVPVYLLVNRILKLRSRRALLPPAVKLMQ